MCQPLNMQQLTNFWTDECEVRFKDLLYAKRGKSTAYFTNMFRKAYTHECEVWFKDLLMHIISYQINCGTHQINCVTHRSGAHGSFKSFGVHLRVHIHTQTHMSVRSDLKMCTAQFYRVFTSVWVRARQRFLQICNTLTIVIGHTIHCILWIIEHIKDSHMAHCTVYSVRLHCTLRIMQVHSVQCTVTV